MPQHERPEMLAILDPGLTTGFVTYDMALGTFTGEQLTFDETCRKLMDMGYQHKTGLYVVSESFRITAATPKNTQAPWSLELIGVARMVARMYTGRELVIQDPGAAKRFASDERLKFMKWHQPRMGHANDAARHLLLALATRGWLHKDTLVSLASV